MPACLCAATLVVLHQTHTMRQVYGPTWKELIQEMFGDGIMSAIDFDMTMERQPDPKARMRVLASFAGAFADVPGCAQGDRVKITFSGKFLPYKRY